MNRILRLLFLATIATRAASIDFPIEWIRDLPQPVEIVCAAKMDAAVQALKGSELAASFAGSALSDLAANGFSATLAHDQKITRKGRNYLKAAFETRKSAHFLLLNEDLLQDETTWHAFVASLYDGIAGAARADYVWIELKEDHLETVKACTAKRIALAGSESEVSRKEKRAFMAGQWAMALGLKLGFEKRPDLFAKKFECFLKAAPKRDEPTLCPSSTD